MISEELALQFLYLLGGIVSLSTVFAGILKIGGLLVTNMDKRNQKLNEALIDAKTSALRNEVRALTATLGVEQGKITRLQLEAGELRAGLNAEKVLRHQETQRATASEERERKLRLELDEKDIIIETLKSLFASLNIVLPDSGINIVIGESVKKEKASTDDLTATAEGVISDLKNKDKGEET
jgi:hypothetical protein